MGSTAPGRKRAPDRRHAHARLTNDELIARRNRMLAEYEAGFDLVEVGARHGLSGSTVHGILRRDPRYTSRASHRFDASVLEAIIVPDWVPSRHHARYRRLTAGNDEHIAAACLRRMKVLEAVSP